MPSSSRPNGNILGAAILGSAIITLGATAGDLTPPSGPVSGTMKTLHQVEPRTPITNDFETLTPIVIDEPGSYYLAEEIFAFPGQHGVEITSSDVTLDLNGFTIRGNVEVGSLDGVHVAAGLNNIILRNGIIRDFGLSGVGAGNADNMIVRDIIAYNNGLTNGGGVLVGDYAVVSGCVGRFNGGTGVGAGFGSVMTECIAGNNGGDGLFIASGAASMCSTQGNGADGIQSNRGVLAFISSIGNAGHGILSGQATTFFGNTARQNGGNGMQAGGSLYANNTSLDNTGAAISHFGTGTLVENHAP